MRIKLLGAAVAAALLSACAHQPVTVQPASVPTQPVHRHGVRHRRAPGPAPVVAEPAPAPVPYLQTPMVEAAPIAPAPTPPTFGERFKAYITREHDEFEAEIRKIAKP